MKSKNLLILLLLANGVFGQTYTIQNGFNIDGGNPVTEISTDATMVSNSDEALVSEKAIKTYVDANVGGWGDTKLSANTEYLASTGSTNGNYNTLNSYGLGTYQGALPTFDPVSGLPDNVETYVHLNSYYGVPSVIGKFGQWYDPISMNFLDREVSFTEVGGTNPITVSAGNFDASGSVYTDELVTASITPLSGDIVTVNATLETEKVIGDALDITGRGTLTISTQTSDITLRPARDLLMPLNNGAFQIKDYNGNDVLVVDGTTGDVTLPNTTVSDITDNKAIVTKEYVDSKVSTFTPTFTSTGATFSMAYAVGSYIKNGRQVTLNLFLKVSSVSNITDSRADIAIGGLPFPVTGLLGNTSVEASGSVSYRNYMDFLTGHVSIAAFEPGVLKLLHDDPAEPNDTEWLMVENFPGGAEFRASITYITD